MPSWVPLNQSNRLLLILRRVAHELIVIFVNANRGAAPDPNVTKEYRYEQMAYDFADGRVLPRKAADTNFRRPINGRRTILFPSAYTRDDVYRSSLRVDKPDKTSSLRSRPSKLFTRRINSLRPLLLMMQPPL